MPLSRSRKVEIIDTMAALLRDAPSVVVTDYRGLDVVEMENLRIKLRESGASLHVIKNTLAARAFVLAGIEPPDVLLTGPSALVVLGEEVSKPTKLLLDFAKDHEELAVRGALFEGAVLDAAGVVMLSKLPTREEVQSMTVGVIIAPARQLVSVLAAPMRDLVGVINARVQKEEQQEEEEVAA